jgi:hypothetical protein
MFAHARAETAISPESQMHLRPWRRLTLWAYAPDFAPSQKTGWGGLYCPRENIKIAVGMVGRAAGELRSSLIFENAVRNTNLPLIDQTVFTLLPLRRRNQNRNLLLGGCRNDPARERKLGRLLRWRLRRVG